MHILKYPKTAMIAAGALAILSGSLAAAPAEARTFVSVGVGLPFFGPPPVVYAPAPVYYAPPPVVYAPAAPAPAGYAPPASQNCRPYQSTIQVNGQAQPINGTACQQPDGSWRIVQ